MMKRTIAGLVALGALLAGVAALQAPSSAGGAAVPQVVVGDSAVTAGLGGFLDRLFGREPAARYALPLDQAFGFQAALTGPTELTVRWNLAPGLYLYRHSLGVSVAEDAPIWLGTPEIPPGTPYVDDFFGESYVFFDSVEFTVPFARTSAQDAPVPLSLQLAFQGCDSIVNYCYAPWEWDAELILPNDGNEALFLGSVATGGLTGGAPLAAARVSEQDRLAGLITGASWPLVLTTFFGLGLLLAFTPCVLPMVPILSSIIAGQATQGRQVTTGRAFSLSLAYVLGMAVTYTAGGAIAAMAGAQLQAFFQRPWMLIAFAGVFVVLALGMFGFYNLQMPAGLQARLVQISNRQRGGTYVGVAVMGALSALILAACVTPPLVAALAVIGQSGDVLRGSVSLFAMSLGMGVPLLLVGASAGKLLPKAGPWMNAVKNAFGLLLLGMAIWMVERLLPAPVVLGLWAALAFLVAVCLGLLRPLGPRAATVRRVARGAGALAAVYGLVLVVGAAAGGYDPLRPLAPLLGGAAELGEPLEFRQVRNLEDLESQLLLAAADGRPVMLDFTADWCTYCKQMERYTFPDLRVHAALGDAMLLQVDLTDNTPELRDLQRHLGMYGAPLLLFYDRDGQELRGYRWVGYADAERLSRHVRTAFAL